MRDLIARLRPMEGIGDIQLNELMKRKTPLEAAGAIEDQGKRIAELESRLEFNPEAPGIDGIYCRDETIRLQEARIAELEAITLPRWSDSATGPLELWKNPRNSLAENIEIADGTIAGLRKRVKKLEAEHASIQSLLPDDLYSHSKDWSSGDLAYRIEWLKIGYESEKSLVRDFMTQLDDIWKQSPIGEVTHSDVLPGDDGLYRHEFRSSERIGLQAELFARPGKVEAQEPVGYVQLTKSGKVAFCDGKPMFMAGVVGNSIHPHPIYTNPIPSNPGKVTVTTDDHGRCVAVTRTDDEGRILSVIWEAGEMEKPVNARLPPERISRIVSEIANMDDRGSPEDWPEAMLVTADELTEIISRYATEGPAVPEEALGRILAEVMDKAVENGASSVSMPDDYVAVAAWLCGVKGGEAPKIEPVNARLVERIKEAIDAYERFGAICTFEGEPMIHASTLLEIAEIAAEAMQAGPVWLTDEQIDAAEDEAFESFRRSRGGCRGQIIMPSDSPDWHLAKAVEKAALRANGFKVEG